MTWRRATAIVLLSVTGILLTHELIVLIWGSTDALISPMMASFLTQWPSFAFAFGALFIGHFSLPRRSWMPWPAPPSWGLAALLATVGALALIDVFVAGFWAPPELSVGVGAVAGHALWAQGPKA